MYRKKEKCQKPLITDAYKTNGHLTVYKASILFTLDRFSQTFFALQK